MKKNLFNTLKEALEQDDRFFSNEGYLLKNTIRDNAINLDKNLIGLLLDNEVLKNKFFIKIKDSLVFDSKNFVDFLNNKEFLENSFTRFKNKVGLSDKQGNFLANSNEIVLSWPYKDCILAGGQDKEDTKRNEIFYNEVLGSDDIDRLLDEKVFTNFKRIDNTGENELKEFKRNKKVNKARGLSEDTITDNLLIKGNNLLALHSLKSNFAGKVKLIYIDPPYNTGNDSFNYNDRFNHSTWLTFMKNRLEVAKNLLKNNGVIVVSLSDKEAHYCKVLMDEVFGINNFLSDIIWNSTKSVTNTAIISDSHTHNLVYFKNKDYYIKNRTEFRLKDDGDGFDNPDNDERGPWKADPFQVGGWRPNQQYEITNPNTGKVYKPNKNSSWKNDYTNFQKLLKDNRIVFGVDGKAGPQRKRFLSEAQERGKVSKTLWTDIETTTNGTQHLKTLFGEAIFDNPKPEGLLERIIDLATNKGDIVLDYHLGSGTTCAVSHKMDRQYIGIEQMDYIETISKERLKKVIEGEQGGISKNIDWKGGGDFVYMEIMEENEKIITQIECNQNDKDLLNIYNTIKNSEFINYFIDIKSIDENIKDFENLKQEDKKRFLIELLDKNLLYKNYSEINDDNNGISNKIKQINNLYYNKKNYGKF